MLCSLFLVLVLSLSAMLVLPSDFIIFLFSNRRVTTGHTFSATTVKFILFFRGKKVGNFCAKRPQTGFPNDPQGAPARQVESQKTSILGSVCGVHL